MTMARYSLLRCRKSAILDTIVGILSILLMDPFPSSHAISPPHPELLEESRRHRSLHEALFPNVSYTSQPLPEGVWEPASTYKRRLDPDDPVSEECDTCMFGTEICRFLSAAECQEMEDLTIAQAGRTRQYVATGVKRPSDSTTNAAIMNTMSTRQAGGGQQEQQQQQPTTEIRTLVILVAWQDHKSKLKTMSKQQINKLWNGVGTDEDTIPTGSIANYTQTQSHGRVTLIADIVDWQLADNTEKHYADGRSGLPKFESNGPELADAFAYILDQMEIANFDFNKYDADGDGVLDHIQFLHTGYGAEMGGSDCTSSAQMQDRIWSHMMPAGRSQWESKSGKKLGAWSVSSVFAGRCGKEIAPLGVMMHEFYHTLGLPDLYDRDGGLSPGLGGLGAYDMISSPFGAIGDQRKPGSLSPWSKLDIGFASAVEIKTNGTYTIRPSSEYSDYFIIKKGFDDEREYLLIENRNNVGVDAPLWNNGILIYKVDETNGVSGNRRRGFPGMEGWPANGKHYPIALLQADGKYDLEQGNNNGDAGDFFKRPNQKLGPGNGEKVASKEGVYPNTDGYAFGDIYSSQITVDNFKEISPPGTYNFRVTFGYEPPCQNFRLDMQTDDYPDEITWFVTANGSERLLMSGQGNGNTVTCLPLGQCYIFRIDDAYKDGMCCAYGEGKYNGFLDDVEILGFAGGSTFKDFETREFCTNPISTQTAPSSPPSEKSNLVPTNSPVKSPTKQPTNAPLPTKQPTKLPTKAPSQSPTKQPTKKLTNRPTPVPTPAPQCDHDVKVYVRTDDKPSETTWELTTVSGIFLTGYIQPQDRASNPLMPDTTYLWTLCINGSHNVYFKIYDSGSDGIRQPGGFVIRIDGTDLDNDGIVSGGRRVVELRIGNRRLKESHDPDHPVVTSTGAIPVPQ